MDVVVGVVELEEGSVEVEGVEVRVEVEFAVVFAEVDFEVRCAFADRDRLFLRWLRRYAKQW